MSTIEELAIDLVVKKNTYEGMQEQLVPLDLVLQARQRVAYLRAQKAYHEARSALDAAVAGEP